jgi:hypothetical protein
MSNLTHRALVGSIKQIFVEKSIGFSHAESTRGQLIVRYFIDYGSGSPVTAYKIAQNEIK